ncbi:MULTISPECIES: zinc-dependent alcohol dehydrogenase family protein [Microbacterium]|uniref:zinc-dependent alcohol dehydrogenase family protein n=1 Tax=Microbacterium TaxID=33882 RepID=UPI00146C96B3|nr:MULTISPECIES: zinc-dependent alcohol dehydrogenase family protein [Microbacterium]
MRAAQMSAWVTRGTGDLERVTIPRPAAVARGVVIRVIACGVCRTDLHVIDGDLARHHETVVPGHQIVGEVVEAGTGSERFRLGDRIGVAWLGSTCGSCPWCVGGRENLCAAPTFTGWDHDGGFAEFAFVDERFAYPLPKALDPVETAPLLCAGIIGYRALCRAHLPGGGVLGLYGFGSSAHLTAQIAGAAGATVHVMTRGEQNRALARASGIGFVGEEAQQPPEPLDSAIVFAPAGELVPVALRATKPGGTVVLAGIHMSDIPAMSYGPHLFQERDLRTVTANTRADGEEFLRLAANLGLHATITRYADRETDRALADLRDGRAAGSLVIDRGTS